MDDIIAEIVRRKNAGECVALASLVWSSGSIPMSDRAKMIVGADGSMYGTIGGGCLEAEVLAASNAALTTGENQLLRYTMTEKQAGESGLNCGGTVRIYTELVEPGEDADLFDHILTARRAREECVLATALQAEGPATAARLWIGRDGRTYGSLGSVEADRHTEDIMSECIGLERGRVYELDLADSKPEIFVEPFLPEPILYVFGGGHVGAQIGAMAKNVGFRVVVIDDRPAFANAARHPAADECLVAEMEEVFADLPIDDQAYIVAATRGHQHDEIVVEQAIKTPARYVGMLGSERKKMMLWKRIEGRGGERARLDRVHAPIGANIGADTPEEIAVSVVAELIAVRRGSYKTWKTKRATVDVGQNAAI